LDDVEKYLDCESKILYFPVLNRELPQVLEVKLVGWGVLLEKILFMVLLF
jgi:hypothetical protein